MEIPSTLDRSRETFPAKLVRLFDEWSISIIIVLFGLVCFFMGAFVMAFAAFIYILTQ